MAWKLGHGAKVQEIGHNICIEKHRLGKNFQCTWLRIYAERNT